ncbi:hypothetical protein Tfer_0625 [Thermincola ferriacetica]|uniref:Uncharacterized protein n=2 Tax=Thermincola TaxID=278993 RepID=D5X975_THEPJ|nr:MULTISPECIES: hypothetical protein [Thermincola]ADG82979.1 hypothetical protein TherJR_2134 [Thermincola potens JR]KNZ70444.1 hypothetical protein Tfer_0625 [Thermincola ferriacetica]
MKTEIYIGNSHLTVAQNNAVLNYGESSLQGWRTRSKTNYSFGRVNGDGNLIGSRLNLLSDPDIFDMTVKPLNCQVKKG